MVELGTSAESRLGSLLERLLNWAEVSLRAGDLEQARATAEEVRAVDPDNERAAAVLQRVAARQVGPWGERALMTLLFSDLVGSTQLSEQVEPEQMRDLFAFYRGAVGEAVQRYGGSLVQFYGDGVLAGFGYPEVHEDDARRAVLAGLDMVVAMRDGRAELQRRIGASADLRVGIHTGRVVITGTDAGTDVLSRDSILGVTPNLAARVQGAGEPGMVVVSDVTYQLVDADFFTRSLGEHRLRGITRPVEIFAVERPRYAAARFDADRYRQAGLVGREEPAARLVSAWEAVLDHPDEAGPLILLGGEAGIGKSRLVVELLDRVQARGGKVLGAGCLPYYSNVPLWPVARMLARTVAASDPSGDADDAAPTGLALEHHLISLGLAPADLVPVLGPLLKLPASTAHPALELDPVALLALTHERLVDWMAALAARSPHLLVVEDLHWADPSTLELLHHVIGRSPPSMLTVATTRDPGAVPWRDHVQLIELGRLDEASALRLVGNLSPGRELDEHERAGIVEQAQGNPLFIEELTRSCLAENRTEPMPLRLQELFTWRLKAPGVDQRVVQVAATVGPVFRASVVAAVIGDEQTVDDQLSLLLQQGVVETTPAAGTYRFRHALMRDAAYETQVLDVRQDTHAKVAEVMAAAGTEPAIVATHLDLAGLGARASAVYGEAAQGAQARGAHEEATRLVTRALELLAELPASTERDLGELGARMLRILSVTSLRGYAAPEVEADHVRAETLAQGLGSRPEVLASVVGIYSYRLTNGDVPTALGLAERLLTMTRHRALSGLQPEVDGCAGYAHLYLGHLPTAEALFERSVRGMRTRSHEDAVSPYWPLPNDPWAAAEMGLACVAALRGEPALALRHEEEALHRAEELGFPRGPFTVGFVKTYAAWIRQFQGDQDAARALAADVVAVGQQHGYAYWVGLGSAYLAGPPDGPPDPAFLSGTVDALRMMGHEAFLASMLATLARMAAGSGDLDRASRLIDDALETAHRTGEMLHVPEILRSRAAFALARGAGGEEPVADLLAAVTLATEQGAAVSRLRAAVDLGSLPPGTRPAQWREVLEEARAAVPPTFSAPETESADRLLAA